MDHSFGYVKDKSGGLAGFWTRDADRASEEATLRYHVVEAIETGIIDKNTGVRFYTAIHMKQFRVIPNTADNNGGSFTMLTQTLAPGEAPMPKEFGLNQDLGTLHFY